MSDRKATCIITGQSLLFGKEYWEKKVKEYGSEENLKKFYIARKAKSLVGRGYGVTEIRRLLSITDETLPSEEDPMVRLVMEYHGKKKSPQLRRFESTLNFSQQVTDGEVTEFINNIRKQGYE